MNDVIRIVPVATLSPADVELRRGHRCHSELVQLTCPPLPCQGQTASRPKQDHLNTKGRST